MRCELSLTALKLIHSMIVSLPFDYYNELNAFFYRWNLVERVFILGLGSLTQVDCIPSAGNGALKVLAKQEEDPAEKDTTRRKKNNVSTIRKNSKEKSGRGTIEKTNPKESVVIRSRQTYSFRGLIENTQKRMPEPKSEADQIST